MKKGYIKIVNEGEIDINSFLLVGATNKRNDDKKIGYFGSGLKYAMSVLLRNKIPFRIFSGEKEIKITTSKKSFRGENFDVIKINNKLTNFTTKMGPDWKSWFAIREIYCNAIDEGKHKIGIAGKPESIKGKTIFYIEFVDELDDLFKNWDLYFSEKRKDLVHSFQNNKIYMGGNDMRIYRKGILCYENKKKSLYHYDIDWIKINESRVMEGEWDFNYRMSKEFAKYGNTIMIRNLLENYKDTYEEDFYWQFVDFFNEEWLDVIDDRYLVVDSIAGYFEEEMQGKKCLILPRVLIESLQSYFKNRVKKLGFLGENDEIIKEPNEKEKKYINEALYFFRKADIKIKHEIKITIFEDNNQLGKATKDKILLSSTLFEHGRKEIIMTILEEESHIQSGQNDKSRGFQDYLFRKMVGMMEEKTGIYL